MILTQETIHTMNRKKGSKGIMVIKVDLQKAYDSVVSDFLEETLTVFGFLRGLIVLIIFSLNESSISIL